MNAFLKLFSITTTKERIVCSCCVSSIGQLIKPYFLIKWRIVEVVLPIKVVEEDAVSDAEGEEDLDAEEDVEDVGEDVEMTVADEGECVEDEVHVAERKRRVLGCPLQSLDVW